MHCLPNIKSLGFGGTEYSVQMSRKGLLQQQVRLFQGKRSEVSVVAMARASHLVLGSQSEGFITSDNMAADGGAPWWGRQEPRLGTDLSE